METSSKIAKRNIVEVDRLIEDGRSKIEDGRLVGYILVSVISVYNLSYPHTVDPVCPGS